MRIDLPEGIGYNTYLGVIAGASAAYATKRRVPSVEEIAAHCNNRPKTISRVISTPEFKALMKARGYSFEKGVKLTPEQYFAVSILTNPTNRKSMSEKLRSAGVTYAQYRAWLKQPHFREYLERISEDMLGEHIADVHTMVVNKALNNGDLTAAKMVYELTGRYDPNKQQITDLQGVIGLLLEVITRYVTDTSALQAIHRDIEAVMAGRTPKAIEQFDVSRISVPVDADEITIFDEGDL